MDLTKNLGNPSGRPMGSRFLGVAIALGGLTAAVFSADVAGATAGHAAAVVISTTKNSKLGTILVSGKTVYTLAGNASACTGACASLWTEVVLPKGVARATTGTGCAASSLGAVTHANGVRQVTYGGKPLFFFAGDKSAGQVTGNGVKDAAGTWSVVVVAKPKAKTTSSGSTGGTTAGTSGGGYGY